MHVRSHKTLLHMDLVGQACPLAPHLIALAEQDDRFAYPPSYKLLLNTWGPGHLLGDQIRLLDPTNRHPTSPWLQWRARLEEASLTPCHDRAYLVDPWVLQTLVVFATGPHFSLAWDIYSGGASDEYHIWVLQTPSRGGQVQWLAASLNEAVALLLHQELPPHLGELVLPPDAASPSSFRPVYGTLQAATATCVEAITQALIAHQERRAWQILDDALLDLPKSTLHHALARRLGPQHPGGPCTLPINQMVYQRWMRFLHKSIQAYAPEFDPEGHIQTAIDELESRSAGRIPFDLELDCPLHVLARIRPHASKPLLLEVFLAASTPRPPAPGTLTLCEFHASGELRGEHVLEITPGTLSTEVAHIWSVHGIHPAARLDLLYTPTLKAPATQPTAL